MELLSESLVASDYRDRLNADLRNATLVRFLVAYVSKNGLDAIGRTPLLKALRNPDSFGVSSLTCACGYEPLLALQRDLGKSEIRLKYFMDPQSRDTDEPDDITLFHSKLVYLRTETEFGPKSVIYLGSHNWSGRALGPGPPRSAEASLRIEDDFSAEHVAGTGHSLASQVNRHLLAAFASPPCLPATSDNYEIFDQWFQTGCKRSPRSDLQEITVVLAVRHNNDVRVSPSDWEGLRQTSIYMQVWREEDGQTLRRATEGILLLVWDSKNDLFAGKQPVLLQCHLSTQNPGPTSELRGSNQAQAAIEGFSGFLWDKDELQRQRKQRFQTREPNKIWSGRLVDFYDFEFPTPHTSSLTADSGPRPMYQFLLEVDGVILPAGGQLPEKPRRLWHQRSLALVKDRNDAKVERVNGYGVTSELYEQIMESLVNEFKVSPSFAKNLPVADYRSPKEGRRITRHPIHEAFIGPEARKNPDEFYRETKRGDFIADLESLPAESDLFGKELEAIDRVQRLFTIPLNKLDQVWNDAATDYQQNQTAEEDE